MIRCHRWALHSAQNLHWLSMKLMNLGTSSSSSSSQFCCWMSPPHAVPGVCVYLSSKGSVRRSGWWGDTTNTRRKATTVAEAQGGGHRFSSSSSDILVSHSAGQASPWLFGDTDRNLPREGCNGGRIAVGGGGRSTEAAHLTPSHKNISQAEGSSPLNIHRKVQTL